MAYNSVSKLRNNVEAIRIALEWDGKRRLNPAELSTLRGYSGFGGLKGILYGDSSLEEWKEAGASETDQKLHTEFMKLFEVLDLNLTGRERKTVLESLKNSILTAFYTPAVVPRTFFDVLKSFTDVKTMYEPSAGAGVFIDEALKIFNLDSVRAYEKDLLTGKVLTTSLYSNSASPVFTKVHVQGFEESGGKEEYDLITSNIPFGAFAVYDPTITDRNLTSKIHNYFFAKGLQKIKDHGILAYLVTDTFLNTVSNKSAREHLFMNADFISLTVLPDMLMKETANTEAPSHFLVVRKNIGKTELSHDEHLLVESQLMNFDGKMIATNNYVYAFGHECTIGDITIGKNQYGKPAREITFKGTEAELESRFRDILLFDFKRRFVMRYEDLKIPVAVIEEFQTKPDVQIVKAVDTVPDHEYDQETTEEVKAQQEDLSESQEIVYVPRDAEEGGPEQTHFEDDDVPVAMADKIFTDETVPFKPMVIVKWEGALMRVSSIGEDGNNVAMALADLVTDREKEIMEMYIRVRDAYYVIDQHEKVFESNHAVMRGKLKTAYDEFVEIFGAMNKTRNKNIIMKDVYGFLILASVEIKNGTNDFSPTDVLTKSSKGETEVFKTQHSAEALAYCLAMIGRVDLRFISEITDKEEEAIIDELGELIYLNPTTSLWETADRYLSGNVYRKMIEAERAYNNRETDNPQLKRSLDAITEIQPQKIPFELLEFNLGERWIPVQYYDLFANWLFEMKHPAKVKIIYFPAVDVFKTEIEGAYSPKMSREYFVQPKGNNSNLYGHDLLEYALENTAPFFTYTQGDQRVPDNDAIQLANDKIETIRAKFIEWLNMLDMDEKNNLVDIYNNTYNCYVLRKYDGSHMLFPGLDLSKLGRNETPISGLYSSQKDTAWRILQDNGAIVDHEVGTGKAQPLDSMILTPTGWTQMRNIKVGDVVISVDGKPTKVIGVFPQGKKDIYRLTMDDGASTKACEEHLWTVNDTCRISRGNEWLNLTTRQMIEENGKVQIPGRNGQMYTTSTYFKEKLHVNEGGWKRNKWQIPVVGKVEFIQLSTYIDPYVVGILIGDGGLSGNTVSFSSADREIVNTVKRLIPKSYTVKKKESSLYDYSIIHNKENREGKNNKFVEYILSLGLNVKSEHKHIPFYYLFNSIENRIKLLQGLMDSDGTVDHRNGSSISFCTVSETLKRDVIQLVRSLGGVATFTTRVPSFCHKGEKKSGQLAYIINIILPEDIIPFNLERKLSLWKPKSKYKPCRFIDNIEYVGEEECQCIKVDHPSQLYVTDDFIVTHNTLIMVVTSYEMKRMSIRRKPCILALKANIADIVKTYRRAYPHARILAPNETDFEKANRARLFHEMKNNDWDCVIMTHDQFGKIPQSPQIQTEIIEEELDNLERDLDSLQGIGWQVSRTMRKGLEGKKANLEAKLRSIRDKVDKNKDKDIDFEDMGIDHLFIDEAHMFKNLTFTTRHERVAGLGNTEGSQKALNMLFAIRTLQRRFNADIQTTFLSGTPISNSLTEMYLLFKYLRPKELAKQNILNFDAWAAVFAKKTTDFEFSVTNQIIAKERFRHFIKVPELALFYNEIADYRTNKSINIDRPELHEELVALPPTPEQQEFTRNLISFAKTGDGDYIGIGKLTEKQDKARMLIATNYAKKMSTDMRLISPFLYDDHPDNKISVCCRKVKEFYAKFEEHKGTQLIFCDLGTPKPNEWNVYDEIRKKLVEEHGIPTEEIAFIHDYNERTRRVLFEKMNAGIIRVLVGSTSKAGTGLNVQERVVATHDLDIPWKPAELEQRGGRGARQGNWLAKMHQGNIVYRFIYATEQSLDNYKFTLLKNKQTFISQMKKNELSVRSIDEGSIDEQSGMNFAEYIAVLSGDTTLLEKAKIDKKLAVLENLRSAHYREQSQNKYILAHREERLEEVEGMLVTLQRDYDLYSSQLTRDETGTKNNPIEIFALKDKLIELEKERLVEEEEIKKIKEELKKKKELFKDGEISEEELLDAEVQKARAKPRVKEASVVIGEYMVDAFKNWKPKPGSGDIYAKIGMLYGFNLYVERTTNHDSSDTIRRAYTGDGNNITFSNRLYARHPEGGLKYYFNHGGPSRDNMKIAARNYLNAIDRCGSILEDYNEQKTKLDYTIAALKSMEDREFGKETEIANLREESKRLEREIKIAIEKSKHAEEQVDEKDKKKSKAKAKA